MWGITGSRFLTVFGQISQHFSSKMTSKKCVKMCKKVVKNGPKSAFFWCFLPVFWPRHSLYSGKTCFLTKIDTFWDFGILRCAKKGQKVQKMSKMVQKSSKFGQKVQNGRFPVSSFFQNRFFKGLYSGRFFTFGTFARVSYGSSAFR